MKKTTFKNTIVSYTDDGQGAAIVALHGFLENKAMFHPFIPLLNKGHRIITIDLLGHGKTDCMGYVHTMEENAAIVTHILNELKITKCCLIGHSMGGYVALAFADLYPEKTIGLVLLNSTAYEDNAERKLNRTRAIKAVKQNFSVFVNMAIANLFSEENRTRLSREIEWVKKEALKTPLQGVVASLEGMKIRKERAYILEKAIYPILFVLGKKDPVLLYDETIVQIKNTTVQLHTFADGHMSTIENRDELSQLLLQFLKQI